MSENPHLINITSTGDTQPVYIMGLGVFWNDLDDSEKETLYESQSYKLGRYQSAFWEVNKNSPDLLIAFQRMNIILCLRR